MSEMEVYQKLTEELKKMGLELTITSNGYSISYNEMLENIIAKLLNDFYSFEGYNLLLQNKNGDMSVSIDTNDKGLPKAMLLNQIGDSLDRYVTDFDYLSSMNLEPKAFYEMFKVSLEYSGNFGIGFLNSPTNKKYIIKTDMQKMQEVLEKAGFEFEGEKVVVPEEEIERFYEILESKKNKEEGQYDRLVNISYISKETGVLTSSEIIGYENEYNLVNDEVKLQELYKEEIIDKHEDEGTFEGDVIDTKDDSEELSYPEEGPKMVKKLGEMPTSTNNHGLSNSVSLVLFLAIDVVAIFVGLFLLMH